MEYRQLGACSLQVSLIGLGTVKLGRTQGLRYPSAFELPDQQTAQRLVDSARELGINLIDTAPAYGESEARLGALLRGHRSHWLICTKVGEEFSDGVSHFDFSPRAVKQSVQRSLKRLNTDYLDIVLIHSNGDDVAILNDSGAWEALQALKAQGVVRCVGISHKTVDGGQRALALSADVVMATMHPQDQTQRAVIRAAAERGCGVLVKKALNSGQGTARDLAWVAAQPGVSSIVVGTIDPVHLTDNVRAACADA